MAINDSQVDYIRAYAESCADLGMEFAPSVLNKAADRIEHLESEVAGVLVQLDELAELWGDEAKFRRCRDRLRAVVDAKGGD